MSRSTAIAQTSSPLFRLPRELRQLIWEEVLAPPKNPRPVHFHVYNKVYDSCLYDTSTAERSSKRIEALTTALLRTCQAIYEEAIQALYDPVSFEVVLLGGHARPDVLSREQTEDGSAAPHNISRRNCLAGVLKTCAQLKRMRRMRLVVQPGWNPSISKWRKRVATFLKVIEHGKVLRTLDIGFSFHIDMDQKLLPSLITPLVPLVQGCISNSGRVHPSLWLPVPPHQTRQAYDDALAILEQAGGIVNHAKSGHGTIEAQVRSKGPQAKAGWCFTRGCFGAFVHNPGPPRTTGRLVGKRMAAVGLLAVLSPIAVPVGAVTYVERKIKKGESWSSLFHRRPVYCRP